MKVKFPNGFGVKHGHWQAAKESNKITCSVCGYAFYNCQFTNPNYCQDCGAKMDEVCI